MTARQAATSEILKVISRSTKDVQPVFDAVAESSLRLLRGWSVIIWRVENDQLSPVAFSGMSTLPCEMPWAFQSVSP